MPVVAIPLEDLNKYMGTDLPARELEALLEQIGCDIEEFTEIRRMRCPRCRNLHELTLQEPLLGACPDCMVETDTPDSFWESVGQVAVVRMDLLPIRPDLFDPAGLARTLRGLLDAESGMPSYELSPSGFVVDADPALKQPESYRPFVRCAVVRGLELDEVSLRLVMKLQELLHWALGRDRKLASIGVYDLSGLETSIRYTTAHPTDFSFVPLQSTDGQPMTPAQILEEHPKGKGYRHLLAQLERYPLLVDSAGQVLSMPPIINSDETRLTLESTDAFIDVTGIAERAVDKALNTIVTSLLEIFPDARAETVEIHSEDGSRTTPDFTPETFKLSVAAAEKLIGMELGSEKTAELLRQMRHDVEGDGDLLTVHVPAYRNDIMHEVDLIEDIAIAFGYDNIEPKLVPNMTIAKERPERQVANRARTALVGMGFFETISLMLSNADEQYTLTGLEDPGDAVLLANPISVEQTMLRTSLLPHLLKLFGHNRGQGLPQRFFEADDVVTMPPGADEPTESLHVAAGILATQAGFADIKAIAESLSRELGLALDFRATDHPTFIPGRVAALVADGREIGVCGEVHPEVLERLRLLTPLVVLELDLQSLA